MKRTSIAAAVAASSVALMSSSASAQNSTQYTSTQNAPTGGEEYNYYKSKVRAPAGAFELTLAPIYTQGWGNLSDSVAGNPRTVQDIGGPSIGAALGLGARMSPRWMVGLSGQFYETDPNSNLGSGATTRGVLAGIDATYHAAPFSRVDPWLQIGGGYRQVWVNPGGAGNDRVFQGFELAKATIGFDFRVSPDVALAPFFGADLNMMVFQDIENVGSRNMADPQFNTFIQAGFMGRFDMGGRRVTPVDPKTVVGKR